MSLHLPSLGEVITALNDPNSEWYADPAISQHTPEYLEFFDAVRQHMVVESMALYWDAEHAVRPLTAQEEAAYANVAERAEETRRKAALLHWPVLAQEPRAAMWKGF